jgi:hypothetical protein
MSESGQKLKSSSRAILVRNDLESGLGAGGAPVPFPALRGPDVDLSVRERLVDPRAHPLRRLVIGVPRFLL